MDCEKQLIGLLFLQNMFGFLILNQLSVCFTTAKIFQETLQWFQLEILGSQITVKAGKLTYSLFFFLVFCMWLN